MTGKPVLAGKTLKELTDMLKAYPAFRSKQIYKWICSSVSSFDEMVNLPLAMRSELKDNFLLFPGAVTSQVSDPDGTVKLGLTLNDGAAIEAVILSDREGRKTACLSTQAGCPMACVFCKTGTLGFSRNLLSSEIVFQFLELRRLEKEISHVVIMGMGEPLLNLSELRKALLFFTEKEGINLSKRRITLSTCGIINGILDLAEKGPDVRLALSLTTAREELRQKLMPVSRDNPLLLVKDALLRYQEKTGHRITLELVLLGGLNTSPRDAEEIAVFAQGLKTVVNILPWNPVTGMKFEGSPLIPPTLKEVKIFTDTLQKLGLKVTQRTRKGSSISGACGQLGVLPEHNN